jgi:hypothetical protein
MTNPPSRPRRSRFTKRQNGNYRFAHRGPCAIPLITEEKWSFVRWIAPANLDDRMREKSGNTGSSGWLAGLIVAERRWLEGTLFAARRVVQRASPSRRPCQQRLEEACIRIQWGNPLPHYPTVNLPHPQVGVHVDEKILCGCYIKGHSRATELGYRPILCACTNERGTMSHFHHELLHRLQRTQCSHELFAAIAPYKRRR